MTGTNRKSRKIVSGLKWWAHIYERKWHHGCLPPSRNSPMSYAQLQLPDSGKEEFTEYSRWRLLVNDGGRHTWHYLKTDEECERWPQNLVDKYWLGLPVVSERVIFIFHIIKNIFRIYLYSHQLKTRCRLLGMDILSINTSSPTMDIGQVNTEDQCSYSQVLWLVHMSRAWASNTKKNLKWYDTSSIELILKTVVGECKIH